VIHFWFSLRNPFSQRWDISTAKHGKLSENKSWEFNTYKTSTIISLEVSISFRCDHAGVHLMGGLFGRLVEFHMYDTRHWDYETNSWEVYEDRSGSASQTKKAKKAKINT